MAALEFKRCERPTLGLELELQLLNEVDGDLCAGIDALLERFPGSEIVKPELFQSCVEINSGICDDVRAMHLRLLLLVRRIIAEAAGLGMRICGAGTHPFCERFALITHRPRYRDLAERYGYLARNQMTYATHIHVGMSSGEQAIRVMRHLTACLPVFLAAAANSPFWRGRDTRFACFRQRVLATSQSYGVPPRFDSWEAFRRYYVDAGKAGLLESVRDVHWDIRPHPDFGTLELRVMDAQSSVGRAAAAAAFVQAVVVYLENTPDEALDPLWPRELPVWLERHNYFEASHLGLDTPYVDGPRPPTRTLGSVFHDLVRIVMPVARSLGSEDSVQRFLVDTTTDAGYRHQHRLLRDTGSLPATVSALARELETETAGLA